MARKDMGMMCMPGQCGPKCIIFGLIASAFAAGGLFLLVAGILKQMAMMPWTAAFWWYFGGFVLWCVAKICKMKACPTCRMG